ncbi:MAG: hypothetical protein ABIZ49_10950, partial [Opitutaceae bacterium]
MKSFLKIFFGGLFAVFSATTVLAQQPVIGVTVTPAFTSQAYGVPLTISAAAVGTSPGAFNFEFFVNGTPIVNVAPNAPGASDTTSWTPPQPGTYLLTAKATDGAGNFAFSLPVQYFATGTIMTSPASGTVVPLGSAVVLTGDA